VQRLSVKSGPPILGLIAVALIVAVVLLFFVVLKGDSDSSPERRPDGIPPTAFLAVDFQRGQT
jgi:hypothetical protein